MIEPQRSMKARRRAAHYDANPPRCQTCARFKKAVTVLRDSLPTMSAPPSCALHKYRVKSYAVCDDWIGKDGSTLEIAEEQTK